MEGVIRHASPEERGYMDAYYGREPDPHMFEGTKRTALNTQELSEYYEGYNNCTDRKDWG